MDVLLVGIDAACRPVLDPMFKDGALPTLQSLLREGASGPLTSQIPPWTASAWPSLYTGKNPGKHGVFDFLAFDGYEWDIVNSTDVKRRTIWEYLDEHGFSSVVVNAPVTDPPREIDGALIPGYLAPNDPRCHPEGILEELREELGGYRVYAERETDERVADAVKLDEYETLTRLRGEAFRYLTAEFDPDFGFIQFQKTDAVFHDFPGDQTAVQRVYTAVDETVAAVLDECDPDVVVLASDHGIGEYLGHEVRVNEVLRREGYLETTTAGQGVPSWFKIKDEQLVKGMDKEGPTFLERLAKLAARGGLTYQRGKAVLERLGLAEFVGRYVSVAAVSAASKQVSFKSSMAYLRSPSELGIRLNVEGRDPAGTVTEEDYERVRDEVIRLLGGLEDPDGEPVFEEVVPREQYLVGPYAEGAVDILCVPNEFQNDLSAHVGDVFGPPEPFNHKLEGIVGITGEGLDTKQDLTDAHLFDITPTILAIFEIPPDTDMDGKALPVVEELTAEDYPAYKIDNREATEDEDVENRLSDLGYLE